MSDNLETIATFWSPAEAHIAKGRLDGAGIPSVLVGEETVAMNWLYSNAVGGIKLQVLEADADRAYACLDEALSVSQQALDQEAAAAEANDDVAETQFPDDFDAAAVEEPAITARERNAQRAWLCTIFSLMFFFFQFYVSYLLVKIYLSDDHLGREYRWRAYAAAAVNIPFTVAICFILRAIFAD